MLMSASGCDSVVTVSLVFNAGTSGMELYAGCENDGYSVTVGGTVYDESNPMGTETLIATNGCDSTVTVNLSFEPASTGLESYTGCQDDGYSVTVGGTVYDQNNPTGTETLIAANGCDSTVTVNLVFNATTSGTETYQGCGLSLIHI